ncbi:MAG: sigma-70 family RNA polymerase sigma factor [Terriglobales bacterium]
MGMLQTCLSDVPPVGPLQAERGDSPAPRQSNSGGIVARRALGKEWAVVQQAIAGDPHAQEHLFARHTGRLYRTAFALLHHKEDAEDAVQDGLYKAYTNLRSFQGRSSFSTWLTRIVINSALMTLRRRRVRPEASLDEILESQPGRLARGVVKARPDPEKICAAIQIHALVEGQVDQLPAAMRAAFRVAGMDGLSARESSQALGISVGAFKSRIHWARRKLACRLQHHLRLGRVR